MKNKTYKNKKSGKLYVVDNIGTVKLNGEWKKCVVYQKQTLINAECEKMFVRLYDDFVDKFEVVEG